MVDRVIMPASTMNAAVLHLPRPSLPAELNTLCARYAAGELAALYVIAHTTRGAVEFVRVGNAPPVPPFWIAPESPP